MHHESAHELVLGILFLGTPFVCSGQENLELDEN